MALTADWRVDLMKAHPRLFQIMPDEPARSFGYPLCEAGWRTHGDFAAAGGIVMADIAAAPVGEEDTFEYQRCGMHVRAAVCLTCSSPSASRNYWTTIRSFKRWRRLAEQDREKNHD